jgi:molecular chaperone GrpE (heat shock protein)
MVDSELQELYLRFAKLYKQLYRIQAELDNVRELIRQKG